MRNFFAVFFSTLLLSFLSAQAASEKEIVLYDIWNDVNISNTKNYFYLDFQEEKFLVEKIGITKCILSVNFKSVSNPLYVMDLMDSLPLQFFLNRSPPKQLPAFLLEWEYRLSSENPKVISDFFGKMSSLSKKCFHEPKRQKFVETYSRKLLSDFKRFFSSYKILDPNKSLSKAEILSSRFSQNERALFSKIFLWFLINKHIRVQVLSTRSLTNFLMHMYWDFASNPTDGELFENLSTFLLENDFRTYLNKKLALHHLAYLKIVRNAASAKPMHFLEVLKNANDLQWLIQKFIENFSQIAITDKAKLKLIAAFYEDHMKTVVRHTIVLLRLLTLQDKTWQTTFAKFIQTFIDENSENKTAVERWKYAQIYLEGFERFLLQKKPADLLSTGEPLSLVALSYLDQFLRSMLSGTSTIHESIYLTNPFNTPLKLEGKHERTLTNGSDLLDYILYRVVH